MHVDNNLSWLSHIKELLLQLAKSRAILYRLRNLLKLKRYGCYTTVLSAVEGLVMRMSSCLVRMSFVRLGNHNG